MLLCLGLNISVYANESQGQKEAQLIQSQNQYIANEQQQINQNSTHQLTQTANLWKAIKSGTYGITDATTPEAGRLMNVMGEQARLIHNHYMVPTLGIVVVGVFSLFLVFYLINGPSKLANGFSKKLIERWSKTDRWLHWLMAVSCLTLMLTGLNIALGRHILSPWLPTSFWGGMILSSKTLHDWIGPLFVLFWFACIIKWMPLQKFKLYDIKWFLMAGGYVHFGPFRGKHPQSGFANAGEKMWFWTLALFGLLISITGFMLVLPKLDLMRDTSIVALIIHSGCAAILIGFTIVHIWMATVLSEGGLESMVSGYCDENWAVQHHNIWYDELKNSKSLRYKTRKEIAF